MSCFVLLKITSVGAAQHARYTTKGKCAPRTGSGRTICTWCDQHHRTNKLNRIGLHFERVSSWQKLNDLHNLVCKQYRLEYNERNLLRQKSKDCEIRLTVI